jgi:DNA polymerase-4
MTATPRKIIHIDMDAFYASVEQRDDPSLRGRPLAVGHPPGAAWSPPPATRRASSACARPCPRPRRCAKCPELVFVPPRFEVYKAVSRQIHAIFADYTDLIEPLSLDEAYLDVTANRAGPGHRHRHRQEIRARILERPA